MTKNLQPIDNEKILIENKSNNLTFEEFSQIVKNLFTWNYETNDWSIRNTEIMDSIDTTIKLKQIFLCIKKAFKLKYLDSNFFLYEPNKTSIFVNSEEVIYEYFFQPLLSNKHWNKKIYTQYVKFMQWNYQKKMLTHYDLVQERGNNVWKICDFSNCTTSEKNVKQNFILNNWCKNFTQLFKSFFVDKIINLKIETSAINNLANLKIEKDIIQEFKDNLNKVQDLISIKNYTAAIKTIYDDIYKSNIISIFFGKNFKKDFKKSIKKIESDILEKIFPNKSIIKNIDDLLRKIGGH